jgi:hypothetical protein
LDNNLNLWVSSFSSEAIDEISGSTHQGIQRVFVSGYHPEGLTYDSSDGLIWAVTWDGKLISVVPSSGAFTVRAITGLNGQTLWNLVFDGNHFIWASDIDGNKVFKVYPEG